MVCEFALSPNCDLHSIIGNRQPSFGIRKKRRLSTVIFTVLLISTYLYNTTNNNKRIEELFASERLALAWIISSFICVRRICDPRYAAHPI